MPFQVALDEAQRRYPEYQFISALTPSEQKSAFHVRTADGRDLCLKIIAPNSDLDRVNREIRALQEIQHPNVVHLIEYTYSTSASAQTHHIIEEFIEGADLSDVLAAAPWTLRDAASFFAQLCDGLAALEDKRVVHRDLKPGNVRVRNDGSPVIIDFGLARHLALADLTRTASGTAIGTPLYFAPEQFEGTKRDIDHRTDLFAVGVLLYQALTGYHPFFRAGMSYDQLSEVVRLSNDAVATAEFARLPKPWQLIVGRLLEKDRARRPNRATQVAEILRKLEGQP